MFLVPLLLGHALQSASLGWSAADRITASIQLLGASHEAVQNQLGKPNAVVEGDAVWNYGTWTPSPRIGFVVSFFRPSGGEQVIAKTVQYVSGSVGAVHPVKLTVAGTRQVPRDFCWTSGESTPAVLAKLNATDIKYVTQKSNPTRILTTCKVGDTPVYIFSRQISGDQIIPAFAAGSASPNFDPNRLDLYSFSVGYCSEWEYTAGFTQQKIIGPGSYADKSLASARWVDLSP